jgi:hypothetical protein
VVESLIDSEMRLQGGFHATATDRDRERLDADVDVGRPFQGRGPPKELTTEDTEETEKANICFGFQTKFLRVLCVLRGGELG